MGNLNNERRKHLETWSGCYPQHDLHPPLALQRLIEKGDIDIMGRTTRDAQTTSFQMNEGKTKYLSIMSVPKEKQQKKHQIALVGSVGQDAGVKDSPHFHSKFRQAILVMQ